MNLVFIDFQAKDDEQNDNYGDCDEDSDDNARVVISVENWNEYGLLRRIIGILKLAAVRSSVVLVGILNVKWGPIFGVLDQTLSHINAILSTSKTKSENE